MERYIHRIHRNNTVNDHDDISQHRLMPISPTFYNITLIFDNDWIPAPNELKILLKRISGAAVNILCR